MRLTLVSCVMAALALWLTAPPASAWGKKHRHHCCDKLGGYTYHDPAYDYGKGSSYKAYQRNHYGYRVYTVPSYTYRYYTGPAYTYSYSYGHRRHCCCR